MRLAFALLISLCALRAATRTRRSGPAARAAADGRTTHRRHAEARRLFPALLGRAHRQPLPRDSALRQRSSFTPRVLPPASVRTISGSTADRRAAARSSHSSASARACCWCSRNESFRSSSPNPAERKSVEDSFAKSVLWGFAVAAESNGRVLVDATDFFLRDGHGAASSLGGYRVDRTRSAVYMPRTKAFPKNTEIEVTLTFANEGAAGGRGGSAADRARGRRRSRPARRRGGRGGGGRARRRTVLRHRGERHADRRGRHPARALLAGRASRRQLQAALRRSARRIRRAQLRRLQRRRSASR